MTNQTPTPPTFANLDEIFAAGDAALASVKAEDEKTKKEIRDYQTQIEKAIVTAAARLIPAPLLPFLSFQYNEEEGVAEYTITAPDCCPVGFHLYQKYNADPSEPETWKIGNTTDDPIFLLGTYYPRFTFDRLPLAMAMAKERGPAPAPAPKVEKPKKKSDYEIMREQLDNAQSAWVDNGQDYARFTVARVTASALIDLAQSLDWITNHSDQFRDSVY